MEWDVPEASNFKSFTNEREIWVVTVNTSFAKAPEGIYDVFIKDKSSGKSMESEGTLAGVMSSFDADHHKEMGHSMHQDETGQRATKKFINDISDEIDFDFF